MQLSSLLQRFNEPETLKMAKHGRELRAKGIDVLDLSLGEPDFDTPEHIKQAAIKAIEDNYSHYTPVAGYLDLREAVCTKFKRDNNLDYKPENIVVSTGAKQSLANTILAVVDKDEEGETEDTPAEEEDVLAIPTGPITRAMTRRLKEAVRNILKISKEQEDCLGRSLIHQDTLIIIQVILPSS